MAMESADNLVPGDLSCGEARRVLEFIGYGRLSAPFWFIGLEEGLGKQDDIDWVHNLKARARGMRSWTLSGRTFSCTKAANQCEFPSSRRERRPGDGWQRFPA